MRQWPWAWRRLIGEYAQETRVVVGMEKENSEIYPRNKSGRGYGERKFRNIPKKQEWSWAWKRKNQKYAQEAEASWVWRRKIQKYAQKARVVVGMEEENSEIYPRSRSGRGYGRVSIRIMHIQTNR